MNVGSKYLRKWEALFGILKRRSYNLREGHRAILLQCQDQSIEDARHGCGENAVARNRRLVAALLPRLRGTVGKEIGRRQGGGSTHAANRDHGLSRQLHQKWHFAAESEVIHLGNGGGQSGCHTSIHRVTTLIQNARACRNLQAIARTHHLASAANRRKHAAMGGLGEGKGSDTEERHDESSSHRAACIIYELSFD